MIEFLNSLINIIVLQSTISLFVFVFNNKRNYSLVILGFFMLAYMFPLFSYIFRGHFAVYINFYFFIGPLFYLYTRSILGVLKKGDYMIFIPGILEFLLQLYFYFDPQLSKEFIDGKYKLLNLFLFDIVLNLHTAYFSFKAIVLIRKYKNEIINIYTIEVRTRLQWILITGVVLIIQFAVLAFIQFFLKELGYSNSLKFIFIPIVGLTVYWISFYGLSQKNLNLSLAFDLKNDDKNEKLRKKDTSEAQEINPIKPEDVLKYEEIVAFFNKTKIFKDKELNIYKISDLMQTSYKEVSFSINTVGKKNFNQFVNEFRVNEAIKLLNASTIELYNLSGIAEEVGFNTRSTFFAAFKNSTGKTPSEYRRSTKTSKNE